MRFASRLAMNGIPSFLAFTCTEERARFKAAAARTADAPLAISSFNRSTCSSSHGLQALFLTDIGISGSFSSRARSLINSLVGGQFTESAMLCAQADHRRLSLQSEEVATRVWQCARLAVIQSSTQKAERSRFLLNPDQG
ncbi:hypothetical protein [Rhodopseudomonas parapalustris]